MELPLVVPAIAAVPFYSGVQLGFTPWREISEGQVRRFAAAAGERNWLHTDRARAARESPWKAPVVPGSLLLSLVPALLPELLVLIGWRAAINSGVERCRFPEHVPIGARIRMAALLGRGRSLPGGGCRLPIDVRFESDRAGEPVCEARVVYIYYP